MAFFIRFFCRCISGATHRHQVGWMSSSSKLQQCFWSACFSWQIWVMSPPKFCNNAVSSAIFLGAGYWFNNLHKHICKAHEIFLDWFAFWFSSSQQDCGLFIAIHRRNPTLKFLEPLAAEHGMIFTLQKGHLVRFKGVVGGGRDVSFLVLQNGPPKSFSGELSQRFWADLLFVEWCRSSNHGLLKGFTIHFRVSLTEPRIKLPDAWWPVIRLS